MPAQASAGCGMGISLASFLRFWAVAARSAQRVFCSVGASETQAIQLQDTLEVREQHLDILPPSP